MAGVRFFTVLNASFWARVGVTAAVYLALQWTVLLLHPTGWAKYWVLQSPDTRQYWDAGIYAQLALTPACTAFYPLWPRLIHWLGLSTELVPTLRLAQLASASLFLLSLPIALFTFEQLLKNRQIAFLSFFLYAVGPNAIFHSIGYTESLFSLLSLLFLLTLVAIEEPSVSSDKAAGWYGVLFALTVGLSLTRTILLQSGFAIACTLGIVLSLRWMRSPSSCSTAHLERVPSQPLSLAAAIGTGSLVGYSLYGISCWRTVGDFWAPFHAQVEWGRTVGLRPSLLLLPRSLLIDLHGLYLPALISVAVIGMLSVAARQRQHLVVILPRQVGWYLLLLHPLVFTGVLMGLARFRHAWIEVIKVSHLADWPRYLGRFSVLYAIAFAGVHSLINLLANSGNLYSTSRHFFGTPFAFVGIGAILSALSMPQLTRLGWGLAVVGVGLLAQQWVSYATDGWLG
ncbi:MAG: hypothetical protein AAGA01_11560 [Cyanobacteria bacterium P01_E01_bin.43]